MSTLWRAVPAVLLSTPLLFAQTSSPVQSPLTTLHASSRLVVVDVVVTDKNGNVVRDLPPSEFSILEDGKTQTISGFEEHTTANATNIPLAPVPKSRPGQYSNAVAQSGEMPVNILLIDVLNSEWKNQADFRQRAMKFLGTMPHGQRMAVFVLGNKLRMAQNFTDDTDQLLKAVKDFRPTVASNSEEDIYREMDFLRFESNLPSKVATSLWRMLNDELEASVTNRVEATLNAFTQLARATSAYPGRKNLIWVSGAFPVTLKPQRFSQKDYQETSTAYGSRLQEVSNLLATNKVAVYPVDIRGLIPGGADASANSVRLVRDYSGFIEVQSSNIIEPQSAMREIASLTGGHAYFNRNELGEAIGKAVDLGSSYYTISYAPLNRNWDGRFRNISVKLARKNMSLAYRRGYYALDEDRPPTLPALERSVHLAMDEFSPLSNGIVFSASASPRDPSGAVTATYNLDGRQLRLHDSGGQAIAGQLAFAVVTWNAKGKLLAQTSQFWELPGDTETVARIEKEGWTHREKIIVPPAATRMRIAVQDRLSGKIGTVDVPVPQPPG